MFFLLNLKPKLYTWKYCKKFPVLPSKSYTGTYCKNILGFLLTVLFIMFNHSACYDDKWYLYLFSDFSFCELVKETCMIFYCKLKHTFVLVEKHFLFLKHLRVRAMCKVVTGRGIQVWLPFAC